MKVLLVLNHATDYRESFLRELGNYVELTVLAGSCERDNLTAPKKRDGYTYVESNPFRVKGVSVSILHLRKIKPLEFDVICCAFSPREPFWFFYFLLSRKVRSKWIWWGQIYGRNDSGLLNSFRKYILQKSSGILVYSQPIVERLKKDYGIEASSFNNTEIDENEFTRGSFQKKKEVNLLYVGRYQPRKKLHRLVELAERRNDVYVRLVGSGMKEGIEIPLKLNNSKQIEVFGYVSGKDLIPHFEWADIVANPGHVGLLVMNAARHGKGIVIDKKSHHAPEYWLAKEAEQPFIPFSDDSDVDKFIDEILGNKEVLKTLGDRLQSKAREKYTIQYMARVHFSMFKSVREKMNGSFGQSDN